MNNELSVKRSEKMMLNQIISAETTIVDAINKHFVKITKKLKLRPTETETNELTLSEILDRYKDHQSIVKIYSHMNDENIYSHSNLSRLRKY